MADPPSTTRELARLVGQQRETILPFVGSGLLVAAGAPRFLSSTLASHSVLYLGFSFADTEVHLRKIIGWINAKVADPPHHYLPLPEDEVKARKADLRRLSRHRMLAVVPYRRDPTHTAVENVALALAPRSGPGVTWVQPPLLRVDETDDENSLRARMSLYDLGIPMADTINQPTDLMAEPPSLVIAGASMGKTTLLKWLPALAGDVLVAALAQLEHFKPAPASAHAPQNAIRDLLLSLDDQQPLAIETLEASGALLLLDGLDEVDERYRKQVLAAIRAALARWPDHTWVISSRPGSEARTLASGEIATFAITPSRRWGEFYLRARSVPPSRVEQAMLDGYGLGDLWMVPVLAERLATRLLDEHTAPISALDLLVSGQYAVAEREARRQHQRKTVLRDWLTSIAIGLELSGRPSASEAELAEIPAAAEMKARTARRRLIRLELLAAEPDRASFPLKPLQEGLCADAILHTTDPPRTLRDVAVARVGGVDRLRDDIDVTIDLVFEHADRATRATLRALDEPRWARTLPTHGDPADAREALDILCPFERVCPARRSVSAVTERTASPRRLSPTGAREVSPGSSEICSRRSPGGRYGPGM